MRYWIVSLFPDLITPHFSTGVYRRAAAQGLVSHQTIALRDFASDARRSCDDEPYGPGRGMVMAPEPLGRALDSINAPSHFIIYPSPAGQPLNNRLLQQLSNYSELVIICGRYEGIDQRVIDRYVDMEISIGDYVISSGELAALVIIDGISRLIPGVINAESLREESFQDELLEYPHYTRPQHWRGMSVPEVLLSGNHAQIHQWRLAQRRKKTLHNRRDIVD